MKEFQDFINQIPPQDFNKAEVYLGKGIILFRPNTFVSTAVVTEDFHFSFPSQAPPPIFIDKKEHDVGKNKLLVINPSVLAQCKYEISTEPYHCLSVKNQFIQKIAQEMENFNPVRFSNIVNPYSNRLKQAIIDYEREFSCFHLHCSLMLESISIQIIVLLLREIHSNVKEKKLWGDDKNYIHIAKDFIQTYYNSNITLEDICNEIHITPYHFIRLFKEKMGMTPHTYLLLTRIEKAKEYLQKRECSISEAAKLCGFISSSHFSTTFKNRTGKSPSDYRKNYFFSSTSKR
ncbi:MAG: helix-turn-helix transcriptional regulator [Eubacteriales bacterium]